MQVLRWGLVFLVIAEMYADTEKRRLQLEISEKPTDFFTKCIHSASIINIVNCAALRTLHMLRRANRKESINIVPGVILLSGDNLNNQGMSKQISTETLPENSTEKAAKLIDLVMEALGQLFSGRTLKVHIPNITSFGVSRGFDEGNTGRGKFKKLLAPLVFGVGTKLFAVVPMMLAGLAVIATKALIAAKLALLVAVIMFVQTLLRGNYWNYKNYPIPYGGASGPGFGTGTGYYPPSWTTNNIGGWGSNSQYPYARSIYDFNDKQQYEPSQEIAYTSQNPLE